MPGLIAITQRATGDNITAAIYNGDRQEIVNGMEPDTLDDASVDLTQSNLILDPGDDSNEVLATNLLEEIEQLRYRIKEMTGGTTWRTKYATRRIPLTWRDTTNWAASGTTSNFAYFIVPDGWEDSTDLTFYYFAASSNGTGTAVMYYTYYIFRDGDAIASPGNTAANFTPGDTDYHLRSHAIVGGGINATDGLVIEVTRLGDDGSDNGGIIVPQTPYLSYSGIGSR